MDKIYLALSGNTVRQNWEFEFHAKEVAAAAEGQLDYRRSRVKFWRGKKAEVIEHIKETGIDVHDTISAQYGTAHNNLNSHAAKVIVDPRLQQDLTECHLKLTENEGLVEHYEAWVYFLKASPTATLKLRHADWLFFFGHWTPLSD